MSGFIASQRDATARVPSTPCLVEMLGFLIQGSVVSSLSARLTCIVTGSRTTRREFFEVASGLERSRCGTTARFSQVALSSATVGLLQPAMTKLPRDRDDDRRRLAGGAQRAVRPWPGAVAPGVLVTCKREVSSRVFEASRTTVAQ